MTYAIGFIGGLFFAAAFPGPSTVIRAGVAKAISAARARLGV